MVLATSALLEAAFFTIGCASIHAMRPHAEKLTAVLIAAVVILGSIVTLASVIPTAAIDRDAPDPPAVYGFE
ncbi:hypothetical protein GCM10007884_49030 [Methylobacterium brachythecii]|uniref:Uncharacterized protein n=2 Tax=Methylobacterium brachythecii TaxID=1176177 RepID=A0ABQ6DBA2_9HYPH|nr:hypothetical protein GCM10007884_49030 [Methylobacterium brachythecii]